MPPIHDLRCKACARLELDVVVGDRPYPECPECGGERDWSPARVNTDLWGQSRVIASLDREFGSRSDLRRYMKENGLQEAGDKVGGARNEDRMRGTIFSGKGFSPAARASSHTGGKTA